MTDDEKTTVDAEKTTAEEVDRCETTAAKRACEDDALDEKSDGKAPTSADESDGHDAETAATRGLRPVAAPTGPGWWPTGCCRHWP